MRVARNGLVNEKVSSENDECCLKLRFGLPVAAEDAEKLEHSFLWRLVSMVCVYAIAETHAVSECRTNLVRHSKTLCAGESLQGNTWHLISIACVLLICI